MRIGLFGGSFNPVHNTHIDVARAVVQRLGLDQVLLVPAGDPYHKRNERMLPASIRYELVLAAVDNEDCLGASDLDMIPDVPTFTVDTLRRAAERYPDSEIFFLMGQDSFETLHMWKDWDRLDQFANLVVISRGKEPDKLYEVAGKLYPDARICDEGLIHLKSGQKVYLLNDLDFKISATQVRKKWLNGCDCSELVPYPVLKEMQKNDKLLSEYW